MCRKDFSIAITCCVLEIVHEKFKHYLNDDEIASSKTIRPTITRRIRRGKILILTKPSKGFELTTPIVYRLQVNDFTAELRRRV